MRYSSRRQRRYVPHTHVQKRHILGMSTSRRNDSRRPKVCRLSCCSITNTPPSTVPFQEFFRRGKPLCRNSEIFHKCMHAETNSGLLFQKWSKSVQDKCPKGHFALVTLKHVLAEPLRRFPPFSLCGCAPWPLTYIPDFIQITSGLGKL